MTAKFFIEKSSTKTIARIGVLILITMLITTQIQFGMVDAEVVQASIDKNITIDLNSTEYFGGATQNSGYFGPDDNSKYVYSGGANTFVDKKVPYLGNKIGGYQVKSAVTQMMGIKVCAGATVTLYYAAGGASRSIYMIDKLVKYDAWDAENVTVFESSDETKTTISHTFDADTSIYFAASAPCYISVIEVSYPEVGSETHYFPMDGTDKDVQFSGDYSFENGQVGMATNFNSGYCSIPYFPLSDSYTVSAWFKPNAIQNNMVLYKFGKSSQDYTALYLNDTNNQLKWIITSGGVTKTINFTSPFKVGKWSYIAVTLKNKMLNIYIDGVLLKSDTVNVSTDGLMDGTENYIGKGSENLNGILDEIHIFDYSMSIGQIGEIMSKEGQKIKDAESVSITVNAGERVNMPSQINVTYENGSTALADVQWEYFDTPLKKGIYTVRGTVNAQGNSISVNGEITVNDDAVKDGYSVAQTLSICDTSGQYRVDGEFDVYTANRTVLDGYIALYDINGECLSIETGDITPTQNEISTLNLSINIASEIKSEVACAKMYLWDKITQQPITKPKNRDIKMLKSGDYGDSSLVSLEENSMFYESQKIGLDYILGVDIDRLLAPEYQVHGLETPNNAVRYEGWETLTGNKTLAGHSLGHWMSAAAIMYRDTNNPELLNMLNYTIDKLDELQELSHSGYIGGCGIETFNNAFDGVPDWTNGGYWVPWYGVHKIYQGLIDNYYYTGNKTALKVLKRFADWAVDGTSRMSYSQMQAMISVEYGGMNEAFAEIYEITGNEAYLETARRFSQDSLLYPLSQGTDNLSGKHANTQIPKVLGAAKLYELDSKKYADYRKTAENFWDFVVNDRSYAIGGNAIAEHFEGIGAETLGIKTCESCNTNNMLKLTEYIYSWTHDSKYMDYYETALYNHILGQQDPDTGSKEYFISTLPGHHRIYEEKYKSWWCCTGTGMENPARYTRNIYYNEGDNLYVNLYIPSTYIWNENGLTLQMETNYPYSENVKIKVLSGEADANIILRVPSWVSGEMTASVGGKQYSADKEYLSVRKHWSLGDELDITIPMAISMYTQRSDCKAVYKYGPIVLGAEFGSVDGVEGVKEYNARERDLDSVAVDVPYIISNGKPLESLVKPIDINALTFEIPSDNSSDGKSITLKPFYEIHHVFYNLYWDIDKESDSYEKELNKITVDRVEPDGQQDELAHDLTAISSNQGQFEAGTKTYFWRDAFGSSNASFSYNMTVNSDTQYLFMRYWGDDNDFVTEGKTYKRNFSIYIDNTKISEQALNSQNPGEVYDVFCKIPSELISGKDNVTVKFIPKNTESCAGRLIETRTTTGMISK